MELSVPPRDLFNRRRCRGRHSVENILGVTAREWVASSMLTRSRLMLRGHDPLGQLLSELSPQLSLGVDLCPRSSGLGCSVYRLT